MIDSRIEIPDKIVDKWQATVNILAEITGVCDALITRVDPPYLEVFQASENEDNSFSRGDKVKLAGHYCEQVIKTKKSLLISNALKDERWRDYPEVEEGLISYYGFPLQWPDGRIFGTLCVHDKKENKYSKKIKLMMEQFKELIESHLEIISQNQELTDLFNGAPVGIFITNSEGNIISFNRAMVNMFGCSNENEAIDTYQDLAEDLYVNSDRRSVFLEKLKEEGAVKNFVFKGKTVDCQQLWLRVNAKIRGRKDNENFIIEGFAVDITDRKKYEQQLKEQKEKLQKSYDELGAYNQEVRAMNEELKNSVHKINQLNTRFKEMTELLSNLQSSSKDKTTTYLSDLLKTAIKLVPEADYGKVCVFDANDNCMFVDSVGHDSELLKQININNKFLFHLDDDNPYLTTGYFFNFQGLSANKRKVLEKALKLVKKSIYINITINSELVGRLVLDIAEDSDKDFSMTTKHLLKSFANLGSAFFSFQKYNELQEEFTKELVLSIIKILEMYDGYTGGHSQHVAELGAEIAREMDLSERKINETYWAGMVHDLGKILVPYDILNKMGPLTEAEYKIMKKHPYWSFQVLNRSKKLKKIAHYVLYHHERWDGEGYPKGLKGEQIPLVSQILAVVDAFDAMRSDRAYRKGLSYEEAIKELKNNKGSQFSPAVVDVFLSYINGIDDVKAKYKTG